MADLYGPGRGGCNLGLRIPAINRTAEGGRDSSTGGNDTLVDTADEVESSVEPADANVVAVEIGGETIRFATETFELGDRAGDNE